MIFYETYVSLILDAPNAKGGCIIKEAENNISDKTEIVMNEVDAKRFYITRQIQWPKKHNETILTFTAKYLEALLHKIWVWKIFTINNFCMGNL